MGAGIFKPKGLHYYKDLVHPVGTVVKANLTQEEACAVLQAYDYGIANLPSDSIEVLDRLMSRLKEEIWP